MAVSTVKLNGVLPINAVQSIIDTDRAATRAIPIFIPALANSGIVTTYAHTPNKIENELVLL